MSVYLVPEPKAGHEHGGHEHATFGTRSVAPAPVDEQGNCGHQLRDADDVVEGAASGRIEDELGRGEQRRGTDHRQRRNTEGAADTPARPAARGPARTGS